MVALRKFKTLIELLTYFREEQTCRDYLELIRWNGKIVCPYKECKHDHVFKYTDGKRYKCAKCQRQFSVKVGTIFEDSKISLQKWFAAIYLITSHKKGISSLQLHRDLGVTQKTAWFMLHRLREAMAERGSVQKLGGEGSGGIVEADETYHGKVENPSEFTTKGHKFRRSKAGRGPSNKRAIVALVERGGRARVFHVATANQASVEKIVRENVERSARLHTDESRLYPRVGAEFASHDAVKHSAGEYARREDGMVIHTNTAEGFFGLFKKGFAGSYQHCGEKYLHRYLSEYEFRFNHRVKLGWNDKERATALLTRTVGRRLTLRQPKEANT